MLNICNFRTAIFAAAILSLACAGRGQQPNAADPLQQIKQDLKTIAAASADDCGWEDGAGPKFQDDTAKLEADLIDQADTAIVRALNEPGAVPGDAIRRTLDAMRRASDRANQAWPVNRRFQYELLRIDPAFVVIYHIRSRSTWSAFGAAQEALGAKEKENSRWKQVGEDDFRWQVHNSNEEMEVYALHRGPSRLARFLARSSNVSCGDGETGIAYDAYEWNPASAGRLQNILERNGAKSRGDFAEYAPIGKLETQGPKITLPYCWWSALDLSVDAVLCSVDTYDVSGDRVRFVGTQTNRPDLQTVARVVQYAKDHDYRAVRGYSASAEIARKLVELMPSSVIGNISGEKYPPIRGDLQTIQIEGDDVLRFFLEEQNGKWVVTRFQVNP